MKRLLWILLCGAGVAALAGGAVIGSGGVSAQSSNGVQFLHALDSQPLEFKYRTQQTITPAVDEFHRTAKNPYRGQDAAIAAGKKLYQKWCKACHLEDGSGRIGPNLTDDNWKYARTGTDQGMFEIIYGGGAGAMQAFGRRMDQDDILKVMAYLEVLGKK